MRTATEAYAAALASARSLTSVTYASVGSTVLDVLSGSITDDCHRDVRRDGSITVTGGAEVYALLTADDAEVLVVGGLRIDDAADDTYVLGRFRVETVEYEHPTGDVLRVGLVDRSKRVREGVLGQPGATVTLSAESPALISTLWGESALRHIDGSWRMYPANPVVWFRARRLTGSGPLVATLCDVNTQATLDDPENLTLTAEWAWYSYTFTAPAYDPPANAEQRALGLMFEPTGTDTVELELQAGCLGILNTGTWPAWNPGYDGWTGGSGGVLNRSPAPVPTSYDIAAGTPIRTAIGSLLTTAWPACPLGFSTGGEVLPAAMSYKATSDWWAEACKLARYFGYLLYFDSEGVAQVELMPTVDDTPALAYVEGENGLVIKRAHKWDGTAPTAVLVRGTNPARITNIEVLVGDPAATTRRLAVIESPLVATADEAYALGYAALIARAPVVDTASWRQLPDMRLEAGDVISVTQLDTTSAVFVVGSVVYELGGEQSVTIGPRFEREVWDLPDTGGGVSVPSGGGGSYEPPVWDGANTRPAYGEPGSGIGAKWGGTPDQWRSATTEDVAAVAADVGNLAALSDTIPAGETVVDAVNGVQSNIGAVSSLLGDLSALDTTAKTSLVAAINELFTTGGGGGGGGWHVGTISVVNGDGTVDISGGPSGASVLSSYSPTVSDVVLYVDAP